RPRRNFERELLAAGEEGRRLDDAAGEGGRLTTLDVELRRGAGALRVFGEYAGPEEESNEIPAFPARQEDRGCEYCESGHTLGRSEAYWFRAHDATAKSGSRQQQGIAH